MSGTPTDVSGDGAGAGIAHRERYRCRRKAKDHHGEGHPPTGLMRAESGGARVEQSEPRDQECERGEQQVGVVFFHDTAEECHSRHDEREADRPVQQVGFGSLHDPHHEEREHEGGARKADCDDDRELIERHGGGASDNATGLIRQRSLFNCGMGGRSRSTVIKWLMHSVEMLATRWPASADRDWERRRLASADVEPNSMPPIRCRRSGSGSVARRCSAPELHIDRCRERTCRTAW